MENSGKISPDNTGRLAFSRECNEISEISPQKQRIRTFTGEYRTESCGKRKRNVHGIQRRS